MECRRSEWERIFDYYGDFQLHERMEVECLPLVQGLAAEPGWVAASTLINTPARVQKG